MLALLETFCKVAELGSLNRAAEALHLTQPAITRQIKALESEMNAVLLIRTPQGVILTQAGEALLPHAHQAIAAVVAARGAVRAASASSASRLCIGAGLQVTLYAMPEAIALFQARWPETVVDLRSGHHREVVDLLLSYEVDAAFIGHDLRIPGVKRIPLYADPLALVLAPSLAATGAVQLSELAGRTLLVLPPQSGLHREVTQTLAQEGVNCRFVEFPSVETLKTALVLGMGQAILPAGSVRSEVESGRLVLQPLRDWSGPQRTIRAMVRAEGEVPQSVWRLISILRELHGEVQA